MSEVKKTPSAETFVEDFVAITDIRDILFRRLLGEERYSRLSVVLPVATLELASLDEDEIDELAEFDSSDPDIELFRDIADALYYHSFPSLIPYSIEEQLKFSTSKEESIFYENRGGQLFAFDEHRRSTMELLADRLADTSQAFSVDEIPTFTVAMEEDIEIACELIARARNDYQILAGVDEVALVNWFLAERELLNSNA